MTEPEKLGLSAFLDRGVITLVFSLNRKYNKNFCLYMFMTIMLMYHGIVLEPIFFRSDKPEVKNVILQRGDCEISISTNHINTIYQLVTLL